MNNSPANTSSRQLYFRLLGYVRPYRKMLFLGLLLTAISAAMEPFLPALMKPLLDNGFVPKNAGGEPSGGLLQQSPWVVPLIIVAVMFVRGVVTFFAGYAMSWVQIRLIKDMRQQMFEHLTKLPSSFFEKIPSSTTISRITNDVNSIGHAATSVGVTLLRESLTVVGLLAWLLYLNWQLTLVTLAVIPLIAWVTKAIGQRLRQMSRSSQRGIATMTQVLQETILCQKVLKVFGGEPQEISRFGRINDAMRGYAMRAEVASSAGSPLVQFFVSLAVAAVIYTALIQSSQGSTTVGSFVSFITAMTMLLAPLRALASVNQPLQSGLAAAESVFHLLDTPIEVETGQIVLSKVQGEIEFQSVRFRYPGADSDALKKIDLHIAPGQTVALVGMSGSGKTTLVGLLPRFHAPSAGRITIDGIDIKDTTLASLRQQMAIVSQETLLFNDTIAANIAYGTMADASPESIEMAAAAANALEFINVLPEGFATVIGENGNRLSGGQRQRLVIARAILKNAPVLILDEATSALDNESERLVQNALESLMKDRTTLVIAHRLSTIERADLIVVMRHGEIVESGTHQALLAMNGSYASLHNIQTSEMAAPG